MALAKKFTVAIDKTLSRAAVQLCKLFGHRWLYKDYSNYIQADGNKYAFKASRSCMRCKQHAYYYSEWIIEERSKIDYVGNYNAMSKIEINKVVYS